MSSDSEDTIFWFVIKFSLIFIVTVGLMTCVFEYRNLILKKETEDHLDKYYDEAMTEPKPPRKDGKKMASPLRIGVSVSIALILVAGFGSLAYKYLDKREKLSGLSEVSMLSFMIGVIIFASCGVVGILSWFVYELGPKMKLRPHKPKTYDHKKEEDADFVKFIADQCENAQKPLNSTKLCNDFIQTTGYSSSLDALKLKLQESAQVKLDSNNRIAKYRANDGSLNLEGDHSFSAKYSAIYEHMKTEKSRPHSSDDDFSAPSPENIFDFVVRKSRDISAPLYISQLAREYKKVTGAVEKNECLVWRIKSFRRRVLKMKDVDEETKVKILFGLSAPIEKDFLKILSKFRDGIVDNSTTPLTTTAVRQLFALGVSLDAELLKTLQINAHVLVDDRNRIIKFMARSEWLILEGVHGKGDNKVRIRRSGTEEEEGSPAPRKANTREQTPRNPAENRSNSAPGSQNCAPKNPIPLAPEALKMAQNGASLTPKTSFSPKKARNASPPAPVKTPPLAPAFAPNKPISSAPEASKMAQNPEKPAPNPSVNHMEHEVIVLDGDEEEEEDQVAKPMIHQRELVDMQNQNREKVKVEEPPSRLRKDAVVEVDGENHLTKYKSDGLELKGDHSLSAKTKAGMDEWRRRGKGKDAVEVDGDEVGITGEETITYENEKRLLKRKNLDDYFFMGGAKHPKSDSTIPDDEELSGMESLDDEEDPQELLEPEEVKLDPEQLLYLAMNC